MTFTVTLTGDATAFEVYGGITAAKHYLLAGISDGAIAWRGLANPDDQSRLLIRASQYIDRMSWQGTPTTPAVGGTTLAWPRTNVVAANGTAIDSSTIPQDILNAVFELAGAFAADPDLETYRDASGDLRSARMGSVAIDYAAPVSAQDAGPQLPPIVYMLIAQYLSTFSTAPVRTSGTDGVSAFDVDDDEGNDIDPFGRNWPL